MRSGDQPDDTFAVADAMAEDIVCPLRFLVLEDDDEPENSRRRCTEMGYIVFEPPTALDTHEPCALQPKPFGVFEILADEVLREISYEEHVPSFLTAPYSQRNSFGYDDNPWSCRSTLNRITGSDRNTGGRNTGCSARDTGSPQARSTGCSARNTSFSMRNTGDPLARNTGDLQETFRSTVKRSLPPDSQDMMEQNSQGSLRSDSRVVAGAASILRNLGPQGRSPNSRRASGSDMALFDELTLTEFVPYEQTWANPTVPTMYNGQDDSSIDGRSTRVDTGDLGIDTLTLDTLHTLQVTPEELLDQISTSCRSRPETQDTLHKNLDQEEEFSSGVQNATDTFESLEFIAKCHSDPAFCETTKASVVLGPPVLKPPVGARNNRPGGMREPGRFRSKS